MSGRHEGFAVMDVSTSMLDDPKVKRLAREAPDRLQPAFLAYFAVVAGSWKEGDRVSIDDAWPLSYQTFNGDVVDALKAVKLLDSDGRVPLKTWRAWFAPARKRRESGRKRWRDWKSRQDQKQGKSNGTAHGSPTVSNGVQTGNRTVPSIPKESNPPTPRKRGARRKAGGIAPLTDYDSIVQRDDDDWLAKP